jgi:hypothetical protein
MLQVRHREVAHHIAWTRRWSPAKISTPIHNAMAGDEEHFFNYRSTQST